LIISKAGDSLLYLNSSYKGLYSAKLTVDIIGTLGILRLAHKKNLLDKHELGQLVEMLHEILFFTDDLEKWVLFNDGS
jgi:predicted nucleic acid-binding protein